ncbi:hypothetical protein DSO57_1009644 [Entomophthora muscae]|uniref:Uncharacterized protein n=1 Tax=Entomophthora muscae TaxID=34485 RepID=A0ACC2U4J4_9FUNG|nr:hypothetical protein DSO57_1009644 [Entomophthora muscae]
MVDPEQYLELEVSFLDQSSIVKTGLTIYHLWKTRPGNKIQIPTLNACRLPAPQIKRPPAHPRFSEIEPPQAEAQAKSQSKNTSIDLRVVAPEEGLLNLPNRGKESPSDNFINLKPSWITNQVQLPEENTGFRPNPMTATQEQDNQVANSRFLTNEQTPGLGAISLPLNMSVQTTWSHIS